jgi:tRNA(Met) cytidine acetyltransferase
VVAAHYQTSPSDLLILLDTPNTHLFIAYGDLLHEPNKSVRRNVVGVCLVCIEGGFTQALDVEILEGRRRVRGHLLPQSFAFHSGCRGASMLRCLRVMRIATAPSNLRNGIATALLGKAEQFCKDESLDYFATSFSATPDVCAFWSRNDFLLLRVGLTKDSSSGSYSIMMGKATTSQAKDLFAELRMKLGYSLKYQLITRYQSMLSETAFFLFSQTDPLLIAGSKGTFVADVDALCQGHRSYESCAGAIFEWLWSVDRQLLQTACSLTSDVLVRRVLQGVSVSTACKELGMSGERSLNQALRDALLVVRQNMLSCHEAACTGDNP